MRPSLPSASLRGLVVGLAALIAFALVAGGAFLVAAEQSRAVAMRPAPLPRLPADPMPPPGSPVAGDGAHGGAHDGARDGVNGGGHGRGDDAVPVTRPALLAVSPSRVPAGMLRAIGRLKRVRKVVAVDGGEVRVSGVSLRLLAVDPVRFRWWTPRPVAEHPEVWNALARGELVADSAAVRRLGLVLGAEYQPDAGPRLRVAASAGLGLPGVDGLVSEDLGRRLGLAARVVVLVHGAADRHAVVRLLGRRAQVVTVAPQPRDSPATWPAVVGRPASYLELYRRAAAVCPGLSWTVLAAIGQVESGHGRNNGPSSAGALGPMQFMPSTWQAYGLDGDGDGRADIWSPYDAVPSAARYLCANGAGRGGDRLRKAVWFYNHSWDYVDRVLSLAAAYGRAYSR